MKTGRTILLNKEGMNHHVPFLVKSNAKNMQSLFFYFFHTWSLFVCFLHLPPHFFNSNVYRIRPSVQPPVMQSCAQGNKTTAAAATSRRRGGIYRRTFNLQNWGRQNLRPCCDNTFVRFCLDRSNLCVQQKRLQPKRFRSYNSFWQRPV